MAIVELVLPAMGESIMEATILKWLKQPGDTVSIDETILEVATDKVDSEVPSTAAGIVDAILFKENDVVEIGAVIATIKTEGEEATVASTPVESDAKPNQQLTETKTADETPAAIAEKNTITDNAGAKFYSPLVLNIAANEGIALSELEAIAGTGKEGRVTKNDILEYLETRGAKPTQTPQNSLTAATEKNTAEVKPAPVVKGDVEIIEMDRMRKLIADHMVKSKQISPHVTSFSEADVTNIVLWREKNKKLIEQRDGVKVTYTPIFIDAIVKCIKRFPLINSSLNGDKIIVKKNINIGMATALPSGNLIVPVIKNTEHLNLIGIAKQVNALADAARNNKLKPEDTQDGSFTLTNVGTFGSLSGTPIINQPQVAVLAVGAIKKRPVVLETELGDVIAIRHMMILSMSYDHRIVDGSLGASFLTAVATELENFKGE